MKIFHLIPLFLCLTVAFSPTVALDFEDVGWKAVERCAGEPVISPEDWTFPGSILMGGFYGIHALSADFETPYVVAFLDYNRMVPGGAGLSPDGRWYAVLEGYRSRVNRDNYQVELTVTDIVVYSTSLARQQHRVPWFNTHTNAEFKYPQMRWLDDTHLIYENGDSKVMVINPFKEVNTPWDRQLTPTVMGWNYTEILFPAPDWSRALYYPNDGRDKMGIYDVQEFRPIRRFRTAPNPEIAWTVDSNYFAAETVEDDSFSITIFDRGGIPIHALPVLSPGERVVRVSPPFEFDQHTLLWSPDSQYLVFSTSRTIYIADLQKKTVIDTCLPSTEGLAWSPDSTRIAFLVLNSTAHRESVPIYVYDVSTGDFLIAAYKTLRLRLGENHNQIIGWRED